MKFNELDKSTQIILKVIFAGLVLAFLWLTRDIVLVLILSLILASAMDPMVDYFSQHRVPRAVSVLAVYVLVFGFAALVISLIIPPAVEQFQMLQRDWPGYARTFEEKLGVTGLSGSGFNDFIGGLVSASGGNGSFVTRTFGVFNGVLSLITVLVVSFYLVAEEKGMKNFIASLIPDHHQEFTMGVVEKIQRKMGLWIIGQIILSFAIFLLTFVGLLILGVENALLLATLAGLLEIVPYIGPILSAIPAVFFAFIQNPPLALAVGLLYLLVQKTEGYVLVPKIMQKTVGTSPLVVLLALLIGFKLAGVIGLLIAVPLVGAITVVINEFIASRPKREELPSGNS